MGILYLDEAGNSGIKDPGQPNLIYGGPFIDPDNWKSVMDDYKKAVAKYKSFIYTKFNKPEVLPASFENFYTKIDFFQYFHFHSAEIINGKQLWLKLTHEQRFEVLKDLITIMKDYDVKFYAGLLNKQKLLSNIGTQNVDPMADFNALLPLYFDYFEKHIGNKNYVVIIADGDPKEKEILHNTLQSENIKKCTPEPFIYSAKDLPILQLADTGLWAIQAFHRLKQEDQSEKAKKIRELYEHLKPILQLYVY